MDEYKKSVSEQLRNTANDSNNTYAYSNQSNYSTTTSANFTITIVVFIFFIILIAVFGAMADMMNYTSLPKQLPIETSLGEENPVLEDELDQQIYYRLSSINFDNAGSIVALYKFDKQTVANWCNFTERDERFNGMVNTFQINYDYIPTSSKEKMKDGLIIRKFEHIKEYPTGSVYAINKDNGYFLFVLISENDLIYGSAGGRYQDLFGE